MKQYSNILVSRLRFLGDIILTTPLLHVLREKYPHASITYLAERPFIEILKNHPAVDHLIILSPGKTSSRARALMQIFSKRWDLAIDLFGNPRSALLTWLSGARIRIGGNFRGRRHLYTHPIADDRQPKTAIEFHLRYLTPLKVVYEARDPYIIVTPEELDWGRDYLRRKGYRFDQPIVGIQAGASWPAKRWFPNRFAVLANRLSAKFNAQILFTMGPGEQELIRDVIRSCNFSVLEPTVLTIRQLASIIKLLDIYISNDCGPMHMGPALGTPTVGIFGPGEPQIWFPYRATLGHRLVYHSLDCSQCHRDLCDEMSCMHAITVDDVYNAAVESLRWRGY